MTGETPRSAPPLDFGRCAPAARGPGAFTLIGDFGVEEKNFVFFFNPKISPLMHVSSVLERSIDKPQGEGNAKSRGGADRGPPAQFPPSFRSFTTQTRYYEINLALLGALGRCYWGSCAILGWTSYSY